jgi:hypothetical protein
MRSGGIAIVLLFLPAEWGCLRETGSRPVEQRTLRTLSPVLTADGIVVQSLLLERPIGDRFLDQELWDSTLPVGEPEQRALLGENGFRIGILTGNLPQRFQELLDSEVDVHSAEEKTFNHRTEGVIATAGPIDECRFEVLTDIGGRPKQLTLPQARCGVLVAPRPKDDGRVLVQFEPRIQHGERREWLRPTDDGLTFTRIDEIPIERFPALAVGATLGASDCLLIGMQADQPRTLAGALFRVEADQRPRMRVLVIRARQNGPAARDLPAINDPARRR